MNTKSFSKMTVRLLTVLFISEGIGDPPVLAMASLTPRQQRAPAVSLSGEFVTPDIFVTIQRVPISQKRSMPRRWPRRLRDNLRFEITGSLSYDG